MFAITPAAFLARSCPTKPWDDFLASKPSSNPNPLTCECAPTRSTLVSVLAEDCGGKPISLIARASGRSGRSRSRRRVRTRLKSDAISSAHPINRDGDVFLLTHCMSSR